jgi:glycosyltransferase involved in cell wall biosynthesis
MRIAFVTHICPHYRVRTFETLARYCDVDFYFFSGADDWYWLPQHGVHAGNFRHEYLPGVRIGRTRWTPSLPFKLWRGAYDVYVKSINGRFALPVTYLVARLRGKPFVLWTGVWTRLGTVAHRLAFPLTRYIYRHADAIVVYGDHVKAYLVNEGVPEDRIFVAPHAIDNDSYNRAVPAAETDALRRDLGIAPDKNVVLFIGRFEEEKGLDVLIDAFASLDRRDAVLVLAGTGSLRSTVEARIRERKMEDRVRLPGYVPPSATVAYYALASVYVLPSVTTPFFKEPWGLVVNEAFNQGVPIIASDSVGAAAGGLVRHGVNGLIVPEGDRAALIRSLRQILDEPDLRRRLGSNARQAIHGWDNEQMVRGFRAAIDAVLPGSAGARCTV